MYIIKLCSTSYLAQRIAGAFFLPQNMWNPLLKIPLCNTYPIFRQTGLCKQLGPRQTVPKEQSDWVYSTGSKSPHKILETSSILMDLLQK